MASWDEVTTGGGMSLLPAGIRTYEITTARPEVNKHTGRRTAVIGLASSAGSGEAEISLEAWDNSPDGVEMFERLFKGAAQGLGFTPSGNIPMVDAANEFASWLPGSGLVGSLVEIEVKHVDSKKMKDDGTPFVNHRVTFRNVVNGSAPTTTAAPSFAGATAGAAADEDPWS